MQRIGILYNPLSEETSLRANQIADWLEQRGIATWCGVSHDAREDPALVKGCDLLLSLGGDGTILRAARLAVPNDVPLLPVAMGHLSFMAEIEPGAAIEVLERILTGDYWVEERTLADVTLHRAGVVIGHWTALNEMLITRADMVRAVVIEVLIDGTPMTTYHADGIIVATPTGSTAYALAAGGPVLDPRSRSLALVAVAPHLTSIPSLVLHETTEISLRLQSWYPTALAIDGQTSVPLEEQDLIVVHRAQTVARFARISAASSWYQNLTQRLRRV
ncbi:MAG: NAD(+)/NADH kinase [Herpetosiphonaceae bacterium]|nr:NAD(+)/NADH kinase [Herpetosiphonaceae bacterium]